MLMEAGIILPPSPGLQPSRPLLFTHQRQCTAYSLPAAAMETGVVVYDSMQEGRETERHTDPRNDKEQDLLTRLMHH